MKIVLDLDDFYSCNHQFAKLDKLNDHFDNFKVTVFSIATCMPEDWVKFDVFPRKYLNMAIHGYYHTFWECHNWDKITALRSITDAEESWTVKGFKAPFWIDSRGTLEACKHLDYWMALNVEEPPYSRVPDGLKIYIHDYDIAHIPTTWDKEYLKLHGHIQNVCGNGIDECFDNLIKLPKDTEFVWIDDYMKLTGGDKLPWKFRDDIPYDCYSLATHQVFAGSMPHTHVEKLWDLAKKEGGPVLEIGAGASTVIFGAATKEVISSDINYDRWFPMMDFVKSHQFNLAGIGGPSGDPKVIANMPDVKVPILFIDGGHTKNGILQDFDNYFKFVKDGGAIVFHDTNHPNYPGILEAVQEIVAQTPLKLEDEIKDPVGLRIYRK